MNGEMLNQQQTQRRGEERGIEGIMEKERELLNY